MTDEDYKDYRDDLVSFLKKKEDDIVQRSRNLQVKFCSHFKNRLS